MIRLSWESTSLLYRDSVSARISSSVASGFSVVGDPVLTVVLLAGTWGTKAIRLPGVVGVVDQTDGV